MLRFIAFIIFIAMTMNVSAQTGRKAGAISGIVKDSIDLYALERATINLFEKDSVFVNFQICNKEGRFNFADLELGKKYKLLISYAGYQIQNKQVKLTLAHPRDSIIILMPLLANDSNQVIVTAVIPVRMNQDTLEINPAGIKIDSNAVAEELFSRVPGLTVWSDGSITYNGKPIPKILVDGKPFTGSDDATIATQNLPKNAIDKIQIYNEIDLTKKQRTKTSTDSLLTMNIKLKAGKQKGYFGKVTAGYGSDNRYESNLSFQMYNKKNTFGFGGGTNNVNKNIDNIQSLFKSNTYRNYNPNFENVGNFNQSGVNKNYLFGTAYSHSFAKTDNSREINQLTANYDIGGNKNFISTKTYEGITAGAETQLRESFNESNGSDITNNLGLNYNKNLGYNKSLNSTMKSSFRSNNSYENNSTDVMDSARNKLSTNSSQSNSSGSSNSINGNLNVSNYDDDNPKRSYSIYLNESINDNKTERLLKSNYKSYTTPQDDTSYNRKYNNETATQNININFDYNGFKRMLLRRYDFFGIDMNFTQYLNIDHSKSMNDVRDYNSINATYIKNNMLSNNETFNEVSYTPALTFSKNFSKYSSLGYRSFYNSITFGNRFVNSRNISDLLYRNIKRNFSLPEFNTNQYYSYNKGNDKRINVNVGYYRKINFPVIDQLAPITDDINPYNVRFGNTTLINNTSNSINGSIDYGIGIPKKAIQLNININGNYTNTKDAVGDSIINDLSGKRYVYLINIDRQKQFYGNGNFKFSKKIKKNEIQLDYNLNFNNSFNPNYIDNIYTRTKTISLANRLSLQLSLSNNKLILKLAENLNKNKNTQTGNAVQSFRNNTESRQFSIVGNINKNFSVSSNVSYTSNSFVSNTVYLWNAFANYRFTKKKELELKLSAFDILKQYQNISSFVTKDATTTRITNGLQQYFLLSLSYYPRKFGKKAIVQKKVNGSDD
jgi:hypothetical protein